MGQEDHEPREEGEGKQITGFVQKNPERGGRVTKSKKYVGAVSQRDRDWAYKRKAR